MMWLVFVIPVAFWFISGLRVIQQYEAGVIFRLGRFAETKRAGLNWIVPMMDRMYTVDLRVVARDVPPQDVITKDNVSVKVSAVIYYKVVAPENMDEWLSSSDAESYTVLMAPEGISARKLRLFAEGHDTGAPTGVVVVSTHGGRLKPVAKR